MHPYNKNGGYMKIILDRSKAELQRAPTVSTRTDEQKKLMKEEVNRLKITLGGVTKMANSFDAPRETVRSWLQRGCIPLYVAEAVENEPELKSQGFTIASLRPDVADYYGK
jgi:hypothetical protein